MKTNLQALLLTSPLLFSACALGSEPGKFDRSLAVSGPVNLDVKSGPGGIDISVGSSDVVVIHAIIRSTFGRVDLGTSDANIRALEQNPPVEQSGNAIRIGYVKDEASLRGVSVTYQIQTPRQTQVHAFADAGGIRIDGVQGPVETTNASGHSEVTGVKETVKMTTVSGGIVARQIGADLLLRNQAGGILVQTVHGSVNAETSNGRIEISGVSGGVHSSTHSASIRLSGIEGAVDAHNDSGSIEALQSSGPVQAETSSGSIRISQSTPAPIRALSGSGAIHVQLAGSAGYQLDAQTLKGKISGKATEALPKTGDRKKNQQVVRGMIAAGGPLVSLQTRSSRIEID